MKIKELLDEHERAQRAYIGSVRGGNDAPGLHKVMLEKAAAVQNYVIELRDSLLCSTQSPLPKNYIATHQQELLYFNTYVSVLFLAQQR